MLHKNAKRLGIEDSATILKAEEFYRFLLTKPISKSISDVAKTVLCLDLAATNSGFPFDKATAIKLCGLRKGIYQNSLNNVGKAIDVDKPITIPELCVQLGYSEIKDTALIILQNYAETDNKIKDLNHPQYISVAVYAACKIKGIKVDKSKLISVSRLKSTKWNELAEEFVKFGTTSIGALSKTAQKRTKNSHNLDSHNLPPENKTKKKIDEEIEDYDVWKERIIKEANLLILQNGTK